MGGEEDLRDRRSTVQHRIVPRVIALLMFASALRFWLSGALTQLQPAPVPLTPTSEPFNGVLGRSQGAQRMPERPSRLVTPPPPPKACPPPTPRMNPTEECTSIAQVHHVLPGRSWGALADAPSLQSRWRSLRCDELVRPSAGTMASASQQPSLARLGLLASRQYSMLERQAAHVTRSTTVEVFSAGLQGYRVFRIPALVRARRALLAFAEARPTVDDHVRELPAPLASTPTSPSVCSTAVESCVCEDLVFLRPLWVTTPRLRACASQGRIDLVMRRSVDGGRTWDALSVVVSGTALGASIGNPVPVYEPRRSHLLLLYCSNEATATEDAIRAGHAGASRRVWIVRSTDGGANWSAPTELTAAVKPAGWTWYATGPGGAIILRNGTLVVPATHADGVGELGSGLDHAHTIVSHDGGDSWHRGGDGAVHSNEATLSELADGRMLLNARDLSFARRRIMQWSRDGGASWSDPERSVDLTEPPPRGCHGAMVATPSGDTLFFSGPHSHLTRERMTLRRSDDGGRTWPRTLELHRGPAAYSSMQFLPNASLGVLYERGETPGAFFAKRIVFERVRLNEHSALGAV